MWAENKKFRGLEIFAIATLTAVAGWLRFCQLGNLGLWGDEGFTFLAVKGVLKQGLPIYPSGNGYYKNLLFTYLTALPCLFGGTGEAVLRATNSFFGLAIVPVFYFAGKRYFPSPLAFLGAVILTFSFWEIEFARQARYYCQLQLLYFLSLHFFYLAFFDGKKELQKVALLFFCATALTHQLGFTLIFSFAILAFIRGPRVLLQKSVLVFTLIFFFWAGVLEFCELFFWKITALSHAEKGWAVSHDLFTQFHFNYFKEFFWLFPKMFWLAAAGGLFALLWRKKEPLSFMVGICLLDLLFMGIGHAHTQPRYVFYLYPVFLCAYLSGLYGVFRLGKRFCYLLKMPGGKLAGGLAMAATLLLTLENCDPCRAEAISRRHYGDKLPRKYLISTTLYERYDFSTTGEFVRQRAAPEDLVIGMHMIFNYIYAGRLDYWLWSALPATWDAYEEKNGKATDHYLGVPLIRNVEELKTLLAKNKDRRIWVITDPAILEREKIQPELARFLRAQRDKIKYHSPDHRSAVYLF